MSDVNVIGMLKYYKKLSGNVSTTNDTSVMSIMSWDMMCLFSYTN